MARDYVDIGSSPSDEDCAQVGSPDYYTRAKAECARFIELIRKTVGEEPPGAHLAVKSNPHDFGTYYEVVCYYQDTDEEAQKYAFRCENDAPAKWDTPAAPVAPLVKGGDEAPAPATQKRAPVKVCDSCLECAADQGIEDRESQEMVMVELGADLEDHICDAVEAPGTVKGCACHCRRR